jgi:hypothetical protein
MKAQGCAILNLSAEVDAARRGGRTERRGGAAESAAPALQKQCNVTGLEIPDHRSELGEVPVVFLGHHRLPALVGLGQHLGS